MSLLTEAEAKTKWCPHSRIVRREESVPGNGGNDLVAGVNRDALGGRNGPDFPYSCRCITSACMAWRWESYRGVRVGIGDERRGFCGAFGIPMESIV